jgi:EpsI family protein
MSGRTRSAWVRAVWLAAAMVCTVACCALYQPRPQAEALARARTPLESLFPDHFGEWQIDPVTKGLIRPAFEQARRFQMYDQVLERVYVNRLGYRMMLSVAYGKLQSAGLQVHRPEVCYKASGFTVSEPRQASLSLPQGTLTVTRLRASMEARPEPITYWRLFGDEVVRDEWRLRWHQMWMGTQGGIPDGMLVRVSSVDGDTQGAYRAQAAFVQAMAAAMTPAQRARVLGQH